jgi:hypothetical protein
MENKMYGILILNRDWADEFNVYGFQLLTEKDNEAYKKFIEENPEFLTKEIEWSFGTNEGFEDFQMKELEYSEITEEEFLALCKIFRLRYRFDATKGQFLNVIEEISEYCGDYDIPYPFEELTSSNIYFDGG